MLTCYKISRGLCVCLTLERLVAPAMLRTVASLLVAGWWRCTAVLSTTTLV